MSGLKFVRQMIGLAWIAVFIVGVVSIFRADWIALLIAAVLWILIGFVFAAVHAALQKAELRKAQNLMSYIALAVEHDQWDQALRLSEQMVSMLRASANRDKTASQKGNGTLMLGPLGISLVGHAALLGAVGKIDQARAALDEGLPLMADFAAEVPGSEPFLDLARDLHRSHVSRSDYESAARRFYSFV